MTQEIGLTQAQMMAAAQVAADTLTNKEIADSLGISPRTLDRWKHLPAFQAQLQSLSEVYWQEVLQEVDDDVAKCL